MSKEKR